MKKLIGKLILKNEAFIIGGFYEAHHVEQLQKQNAELVKFIKSIAENYDCDFDGHRYGTYCRKCEAEKILKSLPEAEWKEEGCECGGEGCYWCKR